MRATLKIIAVVIVLLCIIAAFLPTFGPPSFRYTGSDPSRDVWHFGWPLPLAIYDSQTGFHVGPFAYVVIPLAVATLVMIIAAVILSRLITQRRGSSLCPRHPA